MKRIAALVPAALAALAHPAAAEAAWYGGLSLGQSRTGSALVANRESTIVNGSAAGSSFEARDSGFRLFAGYALRPWLAFEVNYTDLGRSMLRTTTVTTEPPHAVGVFALDRKISGVGLDALLAAPLGERASVYGRVGAVQSRLVAEVHLSGAVVFTSGNTAERDRSTARTETITRFGVGGEYLFTKNAGVRLDWERWLDVGKKFEVGGQGTTGEADTDFFALSVVYRF